MASRLDLVDVKQSSYRKVSAGKKVWASVIEAHEREMSRMML